MKIIAIDSSHQRQRFAHRFIQKREEEINKQQFENSIFEFSESATRHAVLLA